MRARQGDEDGAAAALEDAHRTLSRGLHAPLPGSEAAAAAAAAATSSTLGASVHSLAPAGEGVEEEAAGGFRDPDEQAVRGHGPSAYALLDALLASGPVGDATAAAAGAAAAGAAAGAGPLQLERYWAAVGTCAMRALQAGARTRRQPRAWAAWAGTWELLGCARGPVWRSVCVCVCVCVCTCDTRVALCRNLRMRPLHVRAASLVKPCGHCR